MEKWRRSFYTPVLPLGEDGRRVTGCAKHIELSRQAAAEGMVLLKNEGHLLPLPCTSRIALFGKASVDYVKGGGGSGDVSVDYVHSLLDGLEQKQAEGKVQIFAPLSAFYRDYVRTQYVSGGVPGLIAEPDLPEELLKGAREYTDTALISLSRFSGEGWDRLSPDVQAGYIPTFTEKVQSEAAKKIFPDGDFELSPFEKRMISQVLAAFKRIIVVLNVGGVVSTGWLKNPQIQAALFAGQGGMEGGLAMADLICGDACPSGHLTDTYAGKLEDYPSTANFHESASYVDYTEDIYVGYRYFETIKDASQKVCYPFGYGLSYTEFERTVQNVGIKRKGTGVAAGENAASVCMTGDNPDGEIEVSVCVKNCGSYPGKDVLQLYYSAPQGKLGKPYRVLGAFAKTKLLNPGESTEISLHFPIRNMASYDDIGKVMKSAWVLEAGDYSFFLGSNVREGQKLDFVFSIAQDQVTEQLISRCAPCRLKKRLLADGSYENLPMYEKAEEKGLRRQARSRMREYSPEVRAEKSVLLYDHTVKRPLQLAQVADGTISLETFMDSLTLDEKINLLGGQPNVGSANTFGFGNLKEKGIPNIMTADGPAGLRFEPETGIHTTAWPCATLLASTWNEQLVYEVGAAAALEAKENNIGIWLTPACNIHRSPMCGRNFEYYSEDPVLSGWIGAAMVKGIQSRKIGASLKHFAANNKERNRKDSDSRVSERALREIYLKQFEIIVKNAGPYTVMSSYNLLNGVHTSENKDLLTGILREEWGFDGLVTTDWWTFGEHYREIKAGNDLKMARGFSKRVITAQKEGYISEKEINRSVKRLLELILKME